MTSDRRPVFVTGATGKTGAALVRALRAMDIPVRALVRDRDRAAALPAGVEPVTGTLADREALIAGCRDAQGVYMASFDTPDQAALQRQLIDVCRDAKVAMVVRMSVLSAAADSPSRTMQAHHAGDTQLASSGLGHCILRPSWFHQNFLTWCPGGKLRLPAGDGRIPFIDVRDIAAVAAMALTDPRHDGRIYRLYGPELLDHRAVADILSAATGRHFIYEDIAPETWRQESIDAGMDPASADQILEIFARVRAGGSAMLGGDLETLLGRPGITLAEFARDYAAELAKQV